MKFPKITVITPSYNQGEFIERTILSIIKQNYPNLEYIIMDGGSTDNTVDIIKKYENQIDYWESTKDKGQTDAINKGMRKATGDIVCWINSDDVLLPNALNVVGEFFMKHPDVDFVNGNILEIDRNDLVIRAIHVIMNQYLFKHGCYNIAQQGMFWKRSLFNKLGYLDETFHAKMDAEWLIRVYESGANVKSLDYITGAIRIYGETKTALNGDIWEKDVKKIKERYNGCYSRERKNIYFLYFILLKILHGCYQKNKLIASKYKGKDYRTIQQK